MHPQGTVKYEKPLATRVTIDDNRVSAQYETVDGSMIDCSLKGMWLGGGGCVVHTPMVVCVADRM